MVDHFYIVYTVLVGTVLVAPCSTTPLFVSYPDLTAARYLYILPSGRCNYVTHLICICCNCTFRTLALDTSYPMLHARQNLCNPRTGNVAPCPTYRLHLLPCDINRLHLPPRAINRLHPPLLLIEYTSPPVVLAECTASTVLVIDCSYSPVLLIGCGATAMNDSVAPVCTLHVTPLPPGCMLCARQILSCSAATNSATTTVTATTTITNKAAVTATATGTTTDVTATTGVLLLLPRLQLCTITPS
jgi:hypothetical protein